MPWWAWLLAGLAAAYALVVASLVAAGRRADARALAGIVPDCLRLVRGLLGDPRVPRSRKLALAALLGYLVMPFDLVPDFIPVAGHLDDVLAVVLVLGWVVRGAGAGVVAEHWPGPDRTLEILLGLTGAGHAGRGRATAR